jgi:NAD+ synthase (glutamine-hydrolysing)
MWSWCNDGALFLQTGDMSERAVGYTTIGGDLEGLSVIGNLPRRWWWRCLSGCMRGSGSTGRSLPGYARRPRAGAGPVGRAGADAVPVLDTCLQLRREKLAPSELGTALAAAFPEYPPERLAGFAADFVARFTRSIYKWVQAPLTLHVGTLDLERERALQLPVIQRCEWGGHAE